MSALFYFPAAGTAASFLPKGGAKLLFFVAGTSTPLTTYTTSALSVAHSDPVVADSAGVFPAIYINVNSFKVRLTDKNDVQIWEEDPVKVFFDQVVYNALEFLSTTNSSNFPSSGDKGDLYRVGENFTTAAASGAVPVRVGDFIMANKDGATGITADWDILHSQIGLLAETTLTVAATSIDFTGLDINTHKGYRYEVELVDNSVTGNVVLHYNGDTTAANYWYQYVRGAGASATAFRGNAAILGDPQTGEDGFISGFVSIVGGKAQTVGSLNRGGNVSPTVQTFAQGKTNATVSNITQLTFTAGTNQFGIGSTIRIYRGDV